VRQEQRRPTGNRGTRKLKWRGSSDNCRLRCLCKWNPGGDESRLTYRGHGSGGTPEVVHDGGNGRLIMPTASGALPRVLLGLVSSPLDRQRLVDGARQTTERFDLANMSIEAERVLFDVAKDE